MGMTISGGAERELELIESICSQNEIPRQELIDGDLCNLPLLARLDILSELNMAYDAK